jgi:hypothetical protein
MENKEEFYLKFTLLRKLNPIEVKAKIDIWEGLIFEINTGREERHKLPHFHVKYQDFSASFTIKDCTILEGDLKNKYCKKVYEWYIEHRKELIVFWNKCYPNMKIENKE